MTDGKEIFVKIKAVNNGIATDFCKCVIFLWRRIWWYLVVRSVCYEWCDLFLVDLRSIGVANASIIVDRSAPVPGNVYDGETAQQDLMYTKDQNKVI